MKNFLFLPCLLSVTRRGAFYGICSLLLIPALLLLPEKIAAQSLDPLAIAQKPIAFPGAEGFGARAVDAEGARR